uniref:Uncharacterized protein n=1 Tax=Eutreptiella gymnastica TaxID=73025 RepID=A0A7S4CWQ0_9EUGL
MRSKKGTSELSVCGALPLLLHCRLPEAFFSALTVHYQGIHIVLFGRRDVHRAPSPPSPKRMRSIACSVKVPVQAAACPNLTCLSHRDTKNHREVRVHKLWALA